MSNYEVELCLKILEHAAFSKRTENLRPSEIKVALSLFFDNETIEKAVEHITGKAQKIEVL